MLVAVGHGMFRIYDLRCSLTLGQPFSSLQEEGDNIFTCKYVLCFEKGLVGFGAEEIFSGERKRLLLHPTPTTVFHF